MIHYEEANFRSVPKVPGVYAMKNLTTGKEFIGATMNLKDRASKHFYDLRRGVHYSSVMQMDYGAGHQFAFIILFSLTKWNSYSMITLFNVKAWYILEHDSVNTGYNKMVISRTDTNARARALNPAEYHES